MNRLLLVLVFLSTSAQAMDWQVHGFASQGYLNSNGNSFYGNSREGTWLLREAGVNLSWRPEPRLSFAVQGLLRQAGEHDAPPLTLDYAFLGLTLTSSLDHQGELLLGRVKLPLGFYNETRDVAVTRPSILLPQSIYFDRTRDLALSADGLMWLSDYQGGAGRWQVKFGLLRPRIKDREVEFALFNQDLPGELEPGALWIGKIQYESDMGGWRAALSTLRADGRYPGSSTLAAGRVQFLPMVVSLALERERLGLTGEFALRPVRYRGFAASPFEGRDVTGESYYIQGTWRIGRRLKILGRYDHLMVDRSDADGRRYAQETGEPAHRRYARDWTVGLSLDWSNNWRLQVERHWIDGTAWLTSRDLAQSDLMRRWRLWALMLAYRF